MQTKRKSKTSKALCAAISILATAGITGCTSNSTRDAIANYRQTQDGQEQLFDRTLEIANQDLYLGLSQYNTAHAGDPAALSAGLKATWTARQALEEIRVQYSYERAKADITVGQYLYDQQGWLNAVAGDVFTDASRAGTAASAADKAAGVNSVADLIPAALKPKAAAVPAAK